MYGERVDCKFIYEVHGTPRMVLPVRLHHFFFPLFQELFFTTLCLCACVLKEL